ncbi:MAG: chromosome segregation protein SMC, partial [Candidatus Aminicenantes bacterium]
NPSMNFITVSGDVLHSSGLLNLGEKKEGLFALNQEIKSLRDRIKQLERQISPLTQAIEERQEEEHKLREHIERAEKSLVQIESQISAKDKEKDFAQTEKERTETNIILLNKEIDLLAEDKKAATERLSSVSAKVQTLEDKNTDFVRKIEGEERTITQLQKKAAQEKDSFFELKSQIDILQEKISSAEERIQTIGQRTNIIQSKTVSLDKEILDSDRQKTTIQATISGITDRAAKLEADIKEKEKSLIANENRLKEIQEEQRELEKQLDREKENFENNKDLRVRSEIEKAEVERDLVNLEESCWQDLRKTLQEVKEEITGDIIPDENIEEELEKAKEGLQKIGNVNLMAEEEYTIQQKRYDFLVQERQDLRESITSTKEAISKIDKESKNQFLIALESVNNSFRDVFSLLFEGGNAEVKLADPNNPLESGIEIVAQPPGKRLQSLNLLSGGEKSLTSLAFFFGLFRYKPTPFCILDEVDAALDDANLGRFLNLMKIIKSQTQFIIITHNSKTMEVADYIYGTTMAEPNITSIFSVKIEKSNQGQK